MIIFIKQFHFTSLGEMNTRQDPTEKGNVDDDMEKLYAKCERTFQKFAAEGRKLQNKRKLKCGACGALGHMKTNKLCPLNQGKQGGGRIRANNKRPAPDDDNDSKDSRSSLKKSRPVGVIVNSGLKAAENMANIFKEILNQIRETPDARDFLKPVNVKVNLDRCIDQRSIISIILKL